MDVDGVLTDGGLTFIRELRGQDLRTSRMESGSGSRGARACGSGSSPDGAALRWCGAPRSCAWTKSTFKVTDKLQAYQAYLEGGRSCRTRRPCYLGDDLTDLPVWGAPACRSPWPTRTPT